MTSEDHENQEGHEGEVVSFDSARLPHKHARAEEKLKKAQKAFKQVVNQKLKKDRIDKRKGRKKKPGKKR